MARFCLAYNVSPDDYRRLTILERRAFNTEAARLIAERKDH